MRVEAKGYSKEAFERCLKKFRRETKDIVLEYERGQYYERPQEEKNRQRRKKRKRREYKKKMIQRLGKEKYQELVDTGLVDRFDY